MPPTTTRWLSLLLILLVHSVRGQLSVGGADAFLPDDLDAADNTDIVPGISSLGDTVAADTDANIAADAANAADTDAAEVADEYSLLGTADGDDSQPTTATSMPPEETTLPDFDDLVDELAVTTESSGLTEDEMSTRTGEMEYPDYSLDFDTTLNSEGEREGTTSAVPQLTRRIVYSGGPSVTPTIPESLLPSSRPSSVVRGLDEPYPDDWLPNWPSELLENSDRPARRPTIRFPTESLQTVLAPTPTPSSVTAPDPSQVLSIVPSFTVSKVPITQYFFDLASVTPTHVPGPLFEEDDLNQPQSGLSSGLPDMNQPVTELSSSIPELQSSVFIEAARPITITPSLSESLTSAVTEAGVVVSTNSLAATPVSNSFTSASTTLDGHLEKEVIDNNLDEMDSASTILTTEAYQDSDLETTGPRLPEGDPKSPIDDLDYYEYTTTDEILTETSSTDVATMMPGDPISSASVAILPTTSADPALDSSTLVTPTATDDTFKNSTQIIHSDEPAEGNEEGTHEEPAEKEESAVEETPSSSSTTSVPSPVTVTTPTTITTTTTKTSTTRITAPPATSTSSVPTSTSEVPSSVSPTETLPSLTTTMILPNGTVVKHPLPYIRALVAYSSGEFCQHKHNFRSMLAQWISQHLDGKAHVEPHEIEFFNMPECDTTKPPTEDHINHFNEEIENRLNLLEEDDEQTNVYFYVTSSGKLDPYLTEQFPLFPMDLEISEDLAYLKTKVSQLELVRADGSTNSDLLMEEEASVGTSVIVIIVICSIVGVTIIVALLFFMVVKRRGSTNNYYGRRCTPVSMDSYSMDSVSVYHSFRRKSKRRASGRSVKSYLNQAFDDPNGPSRPLNFAKLTHFISDIDGVYEEFGTIPVNMPKYDELPVGVEDKNRYANVIPVPETRVLLKLLKDCHNSEYINANHVRGARNESKYYIATQAPLDDTVADFWRMIWEQETKVVVMLTDFVEKGIDKCADYLPPSETLDCHRLYGDFQVTLKSRDMREKFVVSNVQLKNLENNLVREVAHMWFTGWPSSGVPNEETAFISFILDVRRTRKKLRAKGPVVVHCSPGTGRTGTFLACDMVMRQFEDQRCVDVPRTVYSIRRDRAGAVQTKEQYAFIYRVINLYASKLTSGNLDSL
ncbi:uncharacterized protein [Panulirus ornatus]